MSNGLKTGHVIRLNGQPLPSRVVTIGPSPPQEEPTSPSQTQPIPSVDVLSPTRQLAQSILQEAQQRAQQLEDAVRQQLTFWRQQQEDEIERLRDEAREEGYRDGWEKGHAEGYQAGAEKAEDEWRRRLEEINSCLQEAVRLKQVMLGEAETEFIHLCIAIVRKVIGQMVDEQENTVRQMVQQALRETQRSGRVRLMVHPADLASIESLYRELTLFMPGEPLELLADPSVQRPGCIIQTDQGVVEATLDAQLETIRERFLALRDKENDHAHSTVEIS